MMRRASGLFLGVLFLLGYHATLAQAEVITGEIEYTESDTEDTVPEHFHLDAHTFPYEQSPIPTVSQQINIWEVTFPSPVETEYENNNTVHCEYFQPKGEGPFPGVVVLHILGGDFDLSRLMCRQFSYNGIASLFVKLPYYGPRGTEGVEREMISADPYETVEGMTQGVLDIRRAAAWLGSQKEVDAEQLGITGVSLGGITSALAASAESRFKKVGLLLAGGDLGQIGFEAEEFAEIAKGWLEKGGSQEELIELVRPVDPVTYAENVRGRKIIMFNALSDELIPKACTESLWKALGEPEIIWWAGGHYTAGRFIFDGLGRLVVFFQPDES